MGFGCDQVQKCLNGRAQVACHGMAANLTNLFVSAASSELHSDSSNKPHRHS